MRLIKRVVPNARPKPMELKSKWNPDSCELEFDKTEKLAAMLASVRESASVYSILTGVLKVEKQRENEFSRNAYHPENNPDGMPAIELKGLRFTRPKLADSTREYEAGQTEYDRLLFLKSGTAKRQTKVH